MALGGEFCLIQSDSSKSPHYFAAFRHDSSHLPSWNETVEMCLQAWRLNAEAYRVEQTGFASDTISTMVQTLNKIGQAMLPPTPPNDDTITRNPYITDITEVLALKLLKNQMPGAVFPRPRVLHKERPSLQHHGIDILGYEQTPDGVVLLIVEVMASVSHSSPPSTVMAHIDQMLRETLNADLPRRLIDELGFALAASNDLEQSKILNGFITAVFSGSLRDSFGQRAVAILIRPVGLWFVSDWKPFFEKTSEFESARIPARVWFGAIECDCELSLLLDKIKDSAVGQGGP